MDQFFVLVNFFYNIFLNKNIAQNKFEKHNKICSFSSSQLRTALCFYVLNATYHNVA